MQIADNVATGVGAVALGADSVAGGRSAIALGSSARATADGAGGLLYPSYGTQRHAGPLGGNTRRRRNIFG